MQDIIASIVVFKNDRDALKRTINSFLGTDLKCRLFVIDNSPENGLKDVCAHSDVEYIFAGRNLGFGAAHNIALRKMLGKTKYSLVLNPDIYFEEGV